MAKTTSKVHYKPGRSKTVPAPTPGLGVTIRGFVRGAIIDPDGTEHVGDWHENAILTEGVKQVMACFSSGSGSSKASWVAVGNQSGAIATNATNFDSTEYNSDSAGSGTVRKTFAPTTSAYGTLTMTVGFASSDITGTNTINAVAIYGDSRIGSGSAFSVATFASSVKSSSQALNVTYTYNFATA